MENSKAYDLPIRIFHWAFAMLFVMSFSIAKLIDDDSALYAYHMISGILMVFLVVLRIVWGFVGSKTSRFTSFKLRPSELIEYFKSVLSSKSKRYLGHNPASSYAVVLMMVSTLGIGLSGLLMTLGISKHFFEEIHELLANGFLIIVLFHIAGVLLHQFKHNDGMIYSMLNGKKAKVDVESEIKSNHIIVALVFVMLLSAMGSYLLKSFDRDTGKLNSFGTQLQLGEGGSSFIIEEHDDDHEKDDD
ncbi:cytochrome b/b6 domain-containing protein [Halobacteriovorax sp. ZH4_bin.1]|uniref:cytochrome b/b6 domain-containing protein n=1 Tax=unclassified Halobacteriovorax TaxID=2639665 RepID=UPI00371C2F72